MSKLGVGAFGRVSLEVRKGDLESTHREAPDAPVPRR